MANAALVKTAPAARTFISFLPDMFRLDETTQTVNGSIKYLAINTVAMAVKMGIHSR